MEKKLFEWDGWDHQDTMIFTFYKPILKIQIGEHMPGAAFDFVNIDYENGCLEFFRGDDKWKYELNFQVV